MIYVSLFYIPEFKAEHPAEGGMVRQSRRHFDRRVQSSRNPRVSLIFIVRNPWISIHLAYQYHPTVHNGQAFSFSSPVRDGLRAVIVDELPV
jgi:hypothetical protein